MDNNNIITDEPIVTITIPTDSPGVTTSQNAEPQVEATQETISPSSPQDVDKSHIHRWIQDSDNKLYCDCGDRVDLQPNPKHEGGRPCKYCLDKEHYQKIAEDYLKKHEESEKPTIPFIEELALKMRIDDHTLVIWANKLKKDDKDEFGEPVLEHPELSTTYSLLKSLQKFRLKQRAMGRYNPVGALSLLRFDHGAIETSKQVHVGDKNEPLVITIVEEVKNVATD